MESSIILLLALIMVLVFSAIVLLNLNKKNQQLLTEIDLAKNEKAQIQVEKANLEGRFSQMEDAYEKLKEIQEQNEEKIKKAFKDISNEALINQANQINEKQLSNLDLILKPFRERIKEFETRVNETTTEATKNNSQLLTEIKYLKDLNQTINTQTLNLTNALKGSQKTQGNWGEMILERVLESSGLQKGIEYVTQTATTNDEGDKIIPDVIVYLPDKKHLVIDSKVSLVAYERYTNAEDGSAEKEQAKKEHLRSIKLHIDSLSGKKYPSSAELNSPDFTILFIPIESGFALSVSEDSSLFNFAWEKKIVLVSPSTLLATLRTIASVWKNENQTKNAIEIARQAGNLYDKFVGFIDDMKRIDHSIISAKKNYDEAFKKLNEGNGNLISKAEKLRKLGVVTSKNLPNTDLED